MKTNLFQSRDLAFQVLRLLFVIVQVHRLLLAAAGTHVVVCRRLVVVGGGGGLGSVSFERQHKTA